MNEKQPDFDGLRIGAFESRRTESLARLISKFGGVPEVSPSLREVPLAENRAAVDFAHRVVTAEVGVAIFLTGVGFRQLLEVVRQNLDAQRYLDSLSDITTIARGPKAATAMKDAGLAPTYCAADPHTWRELLKCVDQHVAVDNVTVAVQEYGKPNASLVAGLEARGARVLAVPVYRWELPEDCGPLEHNVQLLAGGQLDVLLFTSAIQVSHLLQVAASLGLESQVRQSMEQAVVASIGPTTSDMLRDCSLPVDLEAPVSRMGQLVQVAAARAHELLGRKRQVRSTLAMPPRDPADEQAPWYNSPFLKACRGEPTDVTPVWMMRQAGRYMVEYREVRGRVSFLELCKDAALCSEVMCTAVKKLGVDAAIVFSDLLPILEPMGLDLEFAKGAGPVVHNPVRESTDVDRVLELESVDSLHFVMEAISQTRHDLPAHLPLIGFAGAPFTLASYTIEGGSSRNYLHTKTLMHRDPGAWNALMERFARAVIQYLNGQIAAGAQAVQLFDSWAGCLGPDDYRDYVLPHVQHIIAEITAGVPVINFATGNPALNALLGQGGSRVVGVDWRMRLDDAWNIIGHDRAIQGNLDPCVLLADRSVLRRRVREVLDMAGGRPGHIFNLGHGVLPQTPVDNAIALVDAVHELSSV